jgi:hypothetical protein
MTLNQLHELRLWHQQHWRRRPVEKHLWDLVLTLWLAGWVGGPTAFVVHSAAAAVVCVGLVFLPGGYVALRTRLHRAGLVRCDWLVALREP